MAAPSKKKKIVRKNKDKKHYTWVSFEVDMFEGEFVLPDLKHLPLKVMSSLNRGNVSPLVDWMKEAKVEDDVIDAVWDLEQGEVEEFTKAWGDGSLVTLPKSKD